MKRSLAILSFCLVFAATARAQQPAPTATGPDAPATKDDVEAYLQAAHSHEMIGNMIAAMAKPMHEMIHQEFLKDQDKLPPDFEARENEMIDNMLATMPFDDMIQAMVPTYQKYLTKGDLQAMTAFYTSPVGQKLLQEMPAIMAESMQDVMPIMTKYMDTLKSQIQQNIDQALKQSPPQPAAAPPASQN
jgi:uncharacterized protein